MSSNQKHSSLSWTLAISLGIACSAGVVHAGSIGDTYTAGDTLTAAKMDTIKGAVNDNDARIGAIIANTQAGALKTAVDANTTATGNNATAITAIQGTNSTQTTDINNLKGNLTGGTCVTNNASDEMVRVGPICVDKYPASLWDGNTEGAAEVTPTIPVGCAANGDGCTGIFAQSRATPGTALKDATTISWARAARACANAGKRLLTPGEWIMARSFGNTVLSGAGMFTNGSSEWIDAVVATPNTTGSTGNGTFGVGRMGPNIGGSGGSSGSGVVGLLAQDQSTDLPGATIGFRCVR
jgi:hypothetical protein